jgi:NTE family protein
MNVQSVIEPPAHPKPSPRRSASGPRTAFVLSGGASLGALQVGMLRALYERAIEPDFLVGTSAGALNAAYIASRPQTTTTANELERVWRGIQREDVFPVSLRALVSGLSSRGDHLVPDRGLRQIIRRHVEFSLLEEAVIPLHLLTFDLASGKERLLSEGPTVEAVLAATAIPGILPPVRRGPQRLVDGGVVNNTPISHAIELGAERIYVLPTQDGSRSLTPPPHAALDAAIHALTLLVDSRQPADLARYRRDAELIVLPAVNSLRVQPTDFDHAGRLINDAHAAARDFLAATDTSRHALVA